MSRLTTILVLSFMFLFAAGAVVYAYATDAPDSWMHGGGMMRSDFNSMADVCLSNSDLTPEQRDQLRQQMWDHMQSGDWWGHMGGNGPNADNWEEMQQRMEEHMGENWQDHMGGNGPNADNWEEMQQRMEEHMGWSWQDDSQNGAGQTDSNNGQTGQTGAQTGNTATAQATSQATTVTGSQTGYQTVISNDTYGTGSGSKTGTGSHGSGAMMGGSYGPGGTMGGNGSSGTDSGYGMMR